MPFGYDENGMYKMLSGGRVLRIQKRGWNTLLTLSHSQQSLTWEHGW
jgi:hypothetical protein